MAGMMPNLFHRERRKLTGYGHDVSLTAMKTIEVQSLTTSLTDLVELAKREAGLVLTNAGQPVATVLPMPELVKERMAPLHPGAMEVSEDFDAPLPDDFWLGKA